MKNKAFIYVLLAAAALSGCSKNEGGTKEVDGRVALQATSGIQTRAYDKTWEADDAIGIFMLNSTTVEEANKQYTTAETATTSSFTAATGETIYFPVDGSTRDFIAYYPYTASLADGKTYAVDVATQNPQKAIDLMGATKVTGKNKTNPNVAFTFTHKLVKLDITIKADGASLTDEQLAGTTVKITGQQTAATYDVVAGGNVIVTAGTPAEIALYMNGLKAEGIVLPNSDTQGMELTFTVPSLNNQVCSWSIKSAEKSQKFEAGSKYLYTITIAKAGLSVTSTVMDWTAGNGTGENGSAE